MLIPVKRYACPFSVSMVPFRFTNSELELGLGDGEAIAVGVRLDIGVTNGVDTRVSA